MSKILYASVVIGLVVMQAIASDPVSRSTRITGLANQKIPNPILELIGKANRMEQARVWSHLSELSSSPMSFVVKFYCPDADPNDRMMRLLFESEDLRNAREEWHRFWMNNQLSVRTYEKLHGAIGPKP